MSDDVISPDEARSRYGQYSTIGGMSRIRSAGVRFNPTEIDPNSPFLVTPSKSSWSQAHIDTGRRVAEAVGRSTVVPAHMQGMQFIHLVNGTDPNVHPLGQYSASTRSMYVPTDTSAGNLMSAVPHEIGHHVDNAAHGGMSKSEGYNEAVAENFADKHQSPDAPKRDRHYDDLAANGTLSQALGGDEHADDYTLVRKHGRIAGSPRPRWA